VLGKRGSVECNEAPHIPKISQSIDATLMLDMIHYINDSTLYNLLEYTYNNHHSDSMLLIRAVVPPSQKASWTFRLASLKKKLMKDIVYHRSVDSICRMLHESGFDPYYTSPSGKSNQESIWIVSRVKK
jgi:hypothetical protein